MMKDDKQIEPTGTDETQVKEPEGVEDTTETEENEFIEKEEFEALKDVASQLDEKYKRALADYHNLQKRVQDEKSRWIQSSNRELLLRLLPVLDTLMLASSHLNDQGLIVSINQFLDILKAEGVIKIKTEGEAFDPQTMECVVTEEGKENQVLQELRAGYLIHGNVLRAAQVKVGKGK